MFKRIYHATITRFQGAFENAVKTTQVHVRVYVYRVHCNIIYFIKYTQSGQPLTLVERQNRPCQLFQKGDTNCALYKRFQIWGMGET